MGIFTGTVMCAGWLACCIGGAAFRCCCSCCPSSTNSSAVRTGYILVMSVYILIAWIMMSQDIGSKLGEMADETGEVGKEDYYTVETGVDCEGFNSSCDKRWSQLAAYRVLFGPVCFHLAMCIFTVGVQSSRDCRAGLHNGFWGVKILVITGAIVGAFFIKNTFFEDYWGYFGLVGAALFLLLQSWSFVTFSLNLSAFYKDDEGLVEDGAARKLLFFTACLFVVTITIIACMYEYFTCSENTTSTALISINLVMVVLMYLLGLPQSPRNGIFHPALVSFYITYLTWSAVSNTNDLCNLPGDVEANDFVTTLVGITVGLLTIVFITSVQRPDPTDVAKLLQAAADKQQAEACAKDSTTTGANGGAVTNNTTIIVQQTVVDDEGNGCIYNWSLFHLMMACALLYVGCVITDWATVGDDVTNSTGDNTTSWQFNTEPEIAAGRGGASIWLQAIASYIAFLYFIALLAPPLCLPDRDFPQGIGPRRENSTTEV